MKCKYEHKIIFLKFIVNKIFKNLKKNKLIGFKKTIRIAFKCYFFKLKNLYYWL